MTLTAVKLVRVQIFASIGKAIAKKKGVNGYEKIKLQIPYDLSPLLPYDVQNFRIDAPNGHTQHIKISEP